MLTRTLLLSALAGLLAVPAAAQSLADAARRAAEQRQAAGEATQEFTNDDLRPEAPPSVPPRQAPAALLEAADAGGDGAAAAEPGEDGEAPEAESEEAAAGPRDQAYWQGRLSAAREALARAQTLEGALQSRVNQLLADFTAVDDPAQRQVVFEQRQTALAELETMRDTITNTQAEIEAIREEGRRAGAPAGWLR